MIKINDYDSALSYILGLGDLSLVPRLTPEIAHLDLEVMKDLLNSLGNPEQAFPVVHVAGTKGKGSTCGMIAQMLRSAGYKVGLFTSPYLNDFREQIQVNGEWIKPEEFARLVEALQAILTEIGKVSTFEAATAIAFQYFRLKKVDFAVIEVGLGGRLDATNVVDPLITVITSISFDHLSFLGNTIEEIATEKAGIIKPGKPVILAPQAYPAAEEVVRQAAQRLQSELCNVQEENQWDILARDLNGQEFRRVSNNWQNKAERIYKLGLLGDHQVENAITALTVIEKIEELGYSIPVESVPQGLRSSYLSCRFEVIQRNPLVILDGAHNTESAYRLKQTISDYLPGRHITLVFGVSVDKEIEKILTELLPMVEEVIFTKSGHPRAADPAMLVELAKHYPIPSEAVPDLSSAMRTAYLKAGSEGAIIITGSLFTAARAREVIKNQRRQAV